MAGRNLFIFGSIVVAIVLVLVGISGYVVYTNAHDDPVRRADAIVVLGGEHDGREEYGLQLLREGVAPVLVLSNPYRQPDSFMERICRETVPNAAVLCINPAEGTTRGEAMLTGYRDLLLHGIRVSRIPGCRRPCCIC